MRKKAKEKKRQQASYTYIAFFLQVHPVVVWGKRAGGGWKPEKRRKREGGGGDQWNLRLYKAPIFEHYTFIFHKLSVPFCAPEEGEGKRKKGCGEERKEGMAEGGPGQARTACSSPGSLLTVIAAEKMEEKKEEREGDWRYNRFLPFPPFLPLRSGSAVE